MLRTARIGKAGATLVTAFLLLLLAQTAAAGNMNGFVQVGTVIKDEDSHDLTAMPETYNIYEGFSLSRIHLNGVTGQRGSFFLDLKEINRDSGNGLFTYRVQDLGKFSVHFGQHRQLYDKDGSVASLRRNWRFAASATPTAALRLTANVGYETRTGDRLAYPTGAQDALGTGYDYSVVDSRVQAELHRGPRKVAVAWDGISYSDNLNGAADRNGNIFSVRLNGPCYLFPHLVSHYVRAAVGTQELTGSDLQYKLKDFQYLGTVRPIRPLQFRYRFFASRLENDVDGYKTDNIRNDMDLTWYHRYGNFSGGYGYVNRDDDRRLTAYDDWHAAASLHYRKLARLQASYAQSNRTDEEQVTLLKDVESNRWKASLKSSPIDHVDLGVGYVDRERDYPMLGVTANGTRYNAFCRVDAPRYGSLSFDYAYDKDEYVDRISGFTADDNTYTGRVDFTAIDRLDLAAGVTFLNIGGDLDIEKTILMFEGRYDLPKDYFVSVKYNAYDYQDFLLLDRYYTANVVWLNVGYKLSID